MERREIPEHTGRVIALAIAFFGGLALLGYVEGVFDRLSPGTLRALALFALGFAGLTALLDGALRAGVRDGFRRAFARRPSAPRAASRCGGTSARNSAAARARAAG